MCARTLMKNARRLALAQQRVIDPLMAQRPMARLIQEKLKRALLPMQESPCLCLAEHGGYWHISLRDDSHVLDVRKQRWLVSKTSAAGKGASVALSVVKSCCPRKPLELEFGPDRVHGRDGLPTRVCHSPNCRWSGSEFYQNPCWPLTRSMRKAALGLSQNPPNCG